MGIDRVRNFHLRRTGKYLLARSAPRKANLRGPWAGSGHAGGSHLARGAGQREQRAFGLVRWCSTVTRLRGLCCHSLPVTAAGAVI